LQADACRGVETDGEVKAGFDQRGIFGHRYPGNIEADAAEAKAGASPGFFALGSSSAVGLTIPFMGERALSLLGTNSSTPPWAAYISGTA
jgi:hypothetical protein